MVYIFQKLIWPPFVFVVKIFLHFGVRGQENFKLIKGNQYFIVSNHRGHLDPFLVSAAVPFFHFLKLNFRYMTKPQWFKVYPFIKLFGAYPLHRKQETLEQTLSMTEKFIKEGKDILIFPEGTIPKPGESIPAKQGIAYLAKKYKLPILPMFIEGSRNLNSDNNLDLKKIFSRKYQVKIKIGKPFYYDDVASGDMDYHTAAQKIMERVNVLENK